MSSMQDLPPDDLEKHLAVDRYGDFELTDAVRPSPDLTNAPEEGFRFDVYENPEDGVSVPVIMAAATRSKLFALFMDMMDAVEGTPDVILETSHHRTGAWLIPHIDLRSDDNDIPVIKSKLVEFEDLLLNDGCTGIAITNPEIPRELQFDEHKLLIGYGHDLSGFEAVLRQHDIPHKPHMRFITEGEHSHASSDAYLKEFFRLRAALNIEEEGDPPPPSFDTDERGGLALWEPDAAQEEEEDLTERAEDDDEEDAPSSPDIDADIERAEDLWRYLDEAQSRLGTKARLVREPWRYRGMEVVGETNEAWLLWTWDGPGDYHVDVMSKQRYADLVAQNEQDVREAADNEPPQENDPPKTGWRQSVGKWLRKWLGRE